MIFSHVTQCLLGDASYFCETGHVYSHRLRIWQINPELIFWLLGVKYIANAFCDANLSVASQGHPLNDNQHWFFGHGSSHRSTSGAAQWSQLHRWPPGHRLGLPSRTSLKHRALAPGCGQIWARKQRFTSDSPVLRSVFESLWRTSLPAHAFCPALMALYAWSAARNGGTRNWLSSRVVSAVVALKATTAVVTVICLLSTRLRRASPQKVGLAVRLAMVRSTECTSMSDEVKFQNYV